MHGQLESLVALDDWNIALQRIRDVVAAVETYTPDAFRQSIGPLWHSTCEAQARLLSALGTLERETAMAMKPPEIKDESGSVAGWQETLKNGKRAARVSVLGDTITIALEDSKSSPAQPEVPLCPSCTNIVEECPRCEAEAHPYPVRIGGDTLTEFRCSSCGFRFPDSGKNGLCPECLNAQQRK